MNYVVLQVLLNEKSFWSGSGNLAEWEKVINNQAAKGYRLHTITTTDVKGDKVQATMVFEKL